MNPGAIAGPLHDPFFVAVTATAFERRSIADLAAGRIAAIRVPDLLPRTVCEQTLRALEASAFDSYGSRRVYPPVMRFGVGVSDHRKGGQVADSYWSAIERSDKDWAGLGLPFDPFALCRQALGARWPQPVSVGRRGGRLMGSGVAREPNGGFGVHFDDASLEFTGDLLDAHLVAQFAFNLYLSTAESGGETVIWRHRWHPADEAFRQPNSYAYTTDVLGDAESLEITPAVGEALLLDPRNFHAVRPSQGGRRIALGFAVGLSDTGEMFTWG